jgi:hypothetical protein
MNDYIANLHFIYLAVFMRGCRCIKPATPLKGGGMAELGWLRRGRSFKRADVLRHGHLAILLTDSLLLP